MNVGLIDVDSHNFPNIALMKISAYHKKNGDTVEFANIFNKYDIIYKSKIFSWTPDNEYSYNCNSFLCGGTGYNDFIDLDSHIDSICPDYDLYKCEHAYGFLTRGCPNNCRWCVVPKKEGDIKPYSDIEDFLNDFKSAILLDNNVLSSEHGIHQIEKIIKLGIAIDFNQGLDARLIDDSIARLLSKVKWLRPLRLACDSIGMLEPVRKAVELLRWYNCKPSQYFVYVLITDDIDDAIKRIKFLKGLYLRPFAQPFIDFNLNNHVVSRQQRDLANWVNIREGFNTISFEDFQRIRCSLKSRRVKKYNNDEKNYLLWE